MLGKYYCILGWIWAKWAIGEKVWFVPNGVGGLGEAQPQEKLQFLPSFKLKQNCHINMNIFFSCKLAI